MLIYVSGERVCLWEHCFERYPNQNTLVEHIERAHVNTYKGKPHTLHTYIPTYIPSKIFNKSRVIKES